MQDAFADQYIRDIREQFAKLKKRAERALAQSEDNDLFTLLDSNSNSMAIILKHMAGSMRTQWAGFPAHEDVETPSRKRDAEFVIDEQDTRLTLMQQWEAGWRTVFAALNRLTVSDLAKNVIIRGESLTVISAIHRHLTHYAYHIGQIVFLARHFRGDAWESLSIPRGQSDEFAAMMRKRGESR